MTIYYQLFHSPPAHGSLKFVSLLGCDITLFFVFFLFFLFCGLTGHSQLLGVTFYPFVILLGCDIGCDIRVDSNMGGSWLLKDVNQHWWVSQFLESQVHFMTVNLGKHCHQQLISLGRPC